MRDINAYAGAAVAGPNLLAVTLDQASVRKVWCQRALKIYQRCCAAATGVVASDKKGLFVQITVAFMRHSGSACDPANETLLWSRAWLASL